MQIFRRLRYALIAFVAALCLLGVQQGAAFHGLSHLADESQPESQKHAPHAKTCDKCIVYAETGGGGPTTTFSAYQVQADSTGFLIATVELFLSLPRPVYSARAPPISA